MATFFTGTGRPGSSKILLAARLNCFSWNMTSSENNPPSPQDEAPSLPRRFLQLDLIRGVILYWMGFANAYFALSKTQSYWLSHDGQVMSPADLIAVFFLFMIGFNLALVARLKNKTPAQLLRYALQRGVMLALIGSALILYSIVLFGYPVTVLFRSVLVILGIVMILSAGFLYLFKGQEKIQNVMIILGTVFTLVSLRNITPSLDGNLRFLSPWFFLTSLWGYLLGKELLKNPKIFAKKAALFGGASLIAGVLAVFFLHEKPTRLLINPSYIFLSWGVIWFLIALLWQTWSPKPQPGKAEKTLLLAGAHPLSFWIIQGLVIAAAVSISTWFYYQSTNMEHYFWQSPAKVRAIIDHKTAIAAAAASALVSAVAHRFFIEFYQKRKR